VTTICSRIDRLRSRPSACSIRCRSISAQYAWSPGVDPYCKCRCGTSGAFSQKRGRSSGCTTSCGQRLRHPRSLRPARSDRWVLQSTSHQLADRLASSRTGAATGMELRSHRLVITTNYEADLRLRNSSARSSILPGEIRVIATEVPPGCRLSVDRTPQMQVLDDPAQE
jgi:hypothetical protein